MNKDLWMLGVISRARTVEAHLMIYPSSVADVKCVKEEMQQTQEIFASILDEDLLSRVTFIVI